MDPDEARKSRLRLRRAETCTHSSWGGRPEGRGSRKFTGAARVGGLAGDTRGSPGTWFRNTCSFSLSHLACQILLCQLKRPTSLIVSLGLCPSHQRTKAIGKDLGLAFWILTTSKQNNTTTEQQQKGLNERQRYLKIPIPKP